MEGIKLVYAVLTTPK